MDENFENFLRIPIDLRNKDFFVSEKVDLVQMKRNLLLTHRKLVLIIT